MFAHRIHSGNSRFSKGLLAHLLNRKHYTAAKYLDFLPEIIEEPDYVGCYKGNIEFVKCVKLLDGNER